MELPVLNGIIERRILINYRVEPTIVKKIIPEKFDPIIINGYASGGICLLRLKNIGIKYSPSFLRITSENAAHRFLVKWQKNGKKITGVYIPRRDTDSLLNVLLAGKIFSWPHYPATFETVEENGSYFVNINSKDCKTKIAIHAKTSTNFPSTSMFGSLLHASACFEKCSIGYSPSTTPGSLKAIRLKTKTWEVKPLEVHGLRSNFFENEQLFPKNSIAFDNALLMEHIEHEWQSSRI